MNVLGLDIDEGAISVAKSKVWPTRLFSGLWGLDQVRLPRTFQYGPLEEMTAVDNDDGTHTFVRKDGRRWFAEDYEYDPKSTITLTSPVPNINFQVGDFDHNGFEDESFDLVIACASIFPRKDMVASSMREYMGLVASLTERVMKLVRSGGGLYTYDFFRSKDH